MGNACLHRLRCKWVASVFVGSRDLLGSACAHCLLSRATTPPRPQGQREEPPQQNNGGAEWVSVSVDAIGQPTGVFNMSPCLQGFQDGIQFSFGIGAFPFMFFGGVSHH